MTVLVSESVSDDAWDSTEPRLVWLFSLAAVVVLLAVVVELFEDLVLTECSLAALWW